MKMTSKKVWLLTGLVLIDMAAAVYLWSSAPAHVYTAASGSGSGVAESASPDLIAPALDDGQNAISEESAPATAVFGREADVPLSRPGSGLTLGELFILDKIFDDEILLDKNGTTLGDLIILNGLFGGGGGAPDGWTRRLGDLLILNQLFGRAGSPVLDDKTTLGDLFILDQLFDN